MDERKEFGLSLILSITDSQAEKRLQVLMEEAHIPLRIQCHALGTASSELLRICGLGESDRNLTLCVLPKRAVHTLFEKMDEKARKGHCRQHPADRRTDESGTPDARSPSPGTAIS